MSAAPRGKVIALPRGATPVDFGYAIHSDVGNTCVGAKVNGRIVPLRYNLKNGDVVGIITQTGHLPSKDWLSFVKTPRARNKIKHLIKVVERAKGIEIGEKMEDLYAAVGYGKVSARQVIQKLMPESATQEVEEAPKPASPQERRDDDYVVTDAFDEVNEYDEQGNDTV